MCLDRFKDELAFWEIPLDQVRFSLIIRSSKNYHRIDIFESFSKHENYFQLAPCCTVSTALPKEKSVDAGEDWETEFDGVIRHRNPVYRTP